MQTASLGRGFQARVEQKQEFHFFLADTARVLLVASLVFAVGGEWFGRGAGGHGREDVQVS